MYNVENNDQNAMKIINDLHGKGHGVEMTIQRLVDVLKITHEEAMILFVRLTKV